MWQTRTGLDMLKPKDEYQQSILDLAIGHDTDFDVGLYVYDARGTEESATLDPRFRL